MCRVLKRRMRWVVVGRLNGRLLENTDGGLMLLWIILLCLNAWMGQLSPLHSVSCRLLQILIMQSILCCCQSILVSLFRVSFSNPSAGHVITLPLILSCECPNKTLFAGPLCFSNSFSVQPFFIRSLMGQCVLSMKCSTFFRFAYSHQPKCIFFLFSLLFNRSIIGLLLL